MYRWTWLVAAAAPAAFFGYVAVRALLDRPRPIPPAPATPDLRDEPPAVVNVLMRGGRAPQAASAILLDLAARRVVEIIEVTDDQDHTLVRVRDPNPSGLAGYDQRVLDRVRRVAAGGAVAVRELLERYAEGAHRWRERVERDAVLEARRRGLLRRPDRDVTGVGLVAAAVSVAALFVSVVAAVPDFAGGWAGDEGQLGWFAIFPLVLLWAVGTLVLWLIMVIAVSNVVRARSPLTAEGRRVAAHWLGVAAWLRAHEPLRDLPPAAVAVWDRYLAYGAALDVMRHAVRVLDLETVGRRDHLWSDHTGKLRSVRVRYPAGRTLLRPLGPAAAQLSLVWAAITLPVWAVAALLLAASSFSPYARLPLLALALIQVVRAAYRLVRSLLDLKRPVQVTGTLIDIGVAAHRNSADDLDGVPDLPTHYYLVIDDGTSDELRPWLVNRDLAGFRFDTMDIGFQVGDTVRLTGQARSRYATAMTRVATRGTGPGQGDRAATNRPTTREAQ